ncbi:MAG: amidohydrolase [bacterium]|nr:amidohydrolase [bacterium]
MLIDVNVNYGNWPFRRLSINTIKGIEKKLRKNKISKCFISHLGCALNFQEVEEYNEELHKKIKDNKFFCFVPAVNPALTDAEEIIENFRYIKIAPSYHLYSLNDKKFSYLFQKISDKKILVFLQMRYEDERSHNPAFKIGSPSLEEIKNFAVNYPDIKIILLCGYFSEIIQLCKIDNVYSDISFAEYFKTIKSLLKEISPDKLVFGSHTPFLYTEAGIAKLGYAEVEKDIVEKVAYKNIINLSGGRLK